MDVTYQFLKTGTADGIIEIRLDRPPLNVLTIPMMEELVRALEWAKTEPGAVILLSAEGKAFSAGVDVADHTPDKVEDMIGVFDRIFLTMAEIDRPIAAAVNGAALGGGYELVLACDLVVASEKARFGQPEVTVGVFPPAACSCLPR
ncbi:MAG: enoyl-CoA hydratase/isomerase family protein, partial [Desulfotomaculales bacterium]